ncbi:Bug family tripartite tricarboxylate transporter substrate binding protein [Rhizobium leguminosarum]|uniref:Bug family tripartite tricarboxylate transporter substrate binding protein n=1 Tax=Rhizobium leguminosarum TaxID=384 RepID=UPI0014415444|nr:tripartite tricarboxylate transporter substrate binding protein [Rhizobium leguminosarum]
MISVIAALGAAFALSAPAKGEDYPQKPVNIVMPYPTGTASDAVMRMVGAKLETYWGQPVTFENRPGANNWVAVEAFKKAKPDGYTLFEAENFFIALQRHVFKKLPYDPDKDFVPVAGLFEAVSFLMVKADSPWKTLPDIAAAAKDGSLSYGSSGVASSMHIAGVKLETALGAKMTNVPFKDATQAFTAIGNGDLSLGFASTSLAGPMVRAGKIRYFAYADTKRNPNYPDVPTFAEVGGPASFTHKAWLSVFAPRGTPQAIVTKINADIVRALNEPDIREKFSSMGIAPRIGSPDDLTKALADETKLLGELAKANEISLD